MKPAVKLTARQQAFLDKLRELYKAHNSPVHYTAVAEGLGVNRFSAYDMLKVLEEKGYASSSYTLRKDSPSGPGTSGPGRPMIVFSPRVQAAAPQAPSEPDVQLSDDWPSVRERVLTRLQQAREANPREAVAEMLARLPEPTAPLHFCTEMIGALLLNMRRAAGRAGELSPFRALSALRTDNAAELESLAGLSVGMTLADEDEAGHSLTRRLLNHAQRYQSNLSRLSQEARTALVQFLEDALEALD
jgi:hypothetical protein